MWRRAPFVAVAALLSLTVAGGCDYRSAPASWGRTQPDDVTAYERDGSPRCRPGPGRPLGVHLVGRVLRDHGFAVKREADVAICSAEDILVSLTNVSDDEVSAGRTVRRQGHLFCDVRRGAIYGRTLGRDRDATRASPVFSGRKAEFWIANVECSLYPEGPETEQQIDRLEGAMEALAATLQATGG